MKKLFSLEELTDTTPMSSAELVQLDETIAENTQGADDTATLIAETNDDIDEAQRTSDTVALIGDAVEADPNMPEATATALNAALEHLYANVSYTRTRVAQEGMATGKSNALALESIREFGKKVWDAIIAALKKIGEYIKKFIGFITGSTKALEAKAKAAKAEIDQIKRDHSSAKVHEAETIVTEANDKAGLFKGNSVVASSDEPQLLRLANNPSPDRGEVSHAAKVSYGQSNKGDNQDYRTLRHYYAIKNAKLAHYFRERGYTAEGAQPWNMILEGFKNTNAVYSGSVEALEKYVDISSDNHHSVQENVFNICYRHFIAAAKVVWVSEGVRRLDQALTDAGVPKIEGRIYLPFDELLVFRTVGNAHTVAFQKFEDSEADSKKRDLLQLCSLTEAEEALRCLTIGNLTSMAVLAEADKSLLKIIASLDKDAERKVNRAIQANAYPDGRAERNEQKRIDRARDDDKDARDYSLFKAELAFFTQLVIGLTQYKNKMNAHVLEWVSLSAREWEHLLAVRK